MQRETMQKFDSAAMNSWESKTEDAAIGALLAISRTHLFSRALMQKHLQEEQVAGGRKISLILLLIHLCQGSQVCQGMDCTVTATAIGPLSLLLPISG